MGIIFATLIMMISGAIHNNNLSDEEIIKQAMELGMVMPEKESESENGLFGKNTQQQSESAENEVSTEKESVNQQPSSQDPATQEPSSQEPDNQEPASQEPATQEPTTQTPPVHEEIQQYVFIVYPDDMPRQVSTRLEEMGLIDSAVAFRQYLSDNGYSRFIRPGEYIITVGDSYETIAKLITGR